MPVAKEGAREILLATVVLGALAWALSLAHWTLAIPMVVVWIWVLSFFRDPQRVGEFGAGQICAPADGTVTEVTRLEHHDDIGGPAIRIGIFLSIFNVHINRSPCDCTVAITQHKPGKYLDARDPDSGRLNESNTLVLNPHPPHTGPIVVRQVAGLVARRIICHASAGTRLLRGQRFGLIKFGSRTELIVPEIAGTDISVRVADKVRAGLTLMLTQPVAETTATKDLIGEPDGAIQQTSTRSPA